MRKTVTLGTVLLATALAATACGSSGSTAASTSGSKSGAGGGTIAIGEIASLTGNYAPLGTNDHLGAQQAVDEINAAGGINGKQLKLIVEDDKTDPQQAITDFNDLVSKGVVAFVGSSFSNASLAVIPLANRQKIPYVSTAAADQQVQPATPYAYMMPPTAKVVADQLNAYFKSAGMTKMAVAYDTGNAFAQTGWDDMKASAGRYGINFVDAEKFTASQTDFSSVLQHVRSSGAQGLMVWATGAPPVTITKQFASAGMGNMKLAMSHAEASALYAKPAGSAANGVIVASSLATIGPDLPSGSFKTMVMNMVQKFQQVNGLYPPQFAFDGYDAIKVIAAGITKGGSTSRQAIANALNTLTVTAPEGTYHFTPSDHSGLSQQDVAIDVVKSGNFTPTSFTTEQLKSRLK